MDLTETREHAFPKLDCTSDGLRLFSLVNLTLALMQSRFYFKCRPAAVTRYRSTE